MLIGCEFSGIVRDAFIARGHDAISCDFLPSEKPGPHYQGDVRDILGDGFQLMIAHPPCQFICSSGIHWNSRIEGRQQKTEEAIEFVLELWNAPIEKICIENPIGVLSSRFRKPDQIIQPWQFGENASKSTCLFLKNLSKLHICRDNYYPPRIITKNGKEYLRYGNQTDSGQNKLWPSETRSNDRAKTYPKIAESMAEQWNF